MTLVKRILGFSFPLFIIVSFSGCATVPDVKFSYYPVKWNAVAKVTQTIGCSKDKTSLATANEPSVTTSYSSDLDKPPFSINIKKLDGFYADSDFTMTYTDDGRLKSINQSTTGQGETIVKAAVTLATTIATMGLVRKRVKHPDKVLDECTVIEAWAGAGKPVTLVYETAITLEKLGTTIEMEPAPSSKHLYESFKNKLSKPTVDAGKIVDSASGPRYEGSSNEVPDNMVSLKLQKAGYVDLNFSVYSEPIGSARIVIPGNETYSLPIPKAALFGKQTFSLILSEAGAVTSVGYGKTAGTAGALNAAGSVAGFDPTAAKAAALKAQSDLIVQQQRLILCETKPDECK